MLTPTVTLRLPAARRDPAFPVGVHRRPWSTTKRCWISCAGAGQGSQVHTFGLHGMRWLLGAAGLLAGYRATTHWSRWISAPLGATADHDAVCVDRNRVTGGGGTGWPSILRLTLVSAGWSTARTAEANPAHGSK